MKEKGFLKQPGNNNPVMTGHFGADPYAIVYDGRVYLYMTGDEIGYNEAGEIAENTYGDIRTIRVISSDDLVNWTDHGAINAAGADGMAKWGGNSWAPAACYKVIDGKVKFFLYFANSGNGIAVLTADSPVGPFIDPIGKALISRETPNCASVEWLFDPAVLVDGDDAYLYVGGGIPSPDMIANPGTARVVKLGADMISLAGTPQVIDAPYLFEDSELNVINGKYVYSYCKNWKTTDGTSAQIAYMTSDSPLSGYTYKGVIVKNPGSYFGSNLTSNNHHCMFEFNGQWYILYHTMYLENQTYGTTKGYRSLNIDKLNVSSTGALSATMTYKGVDAVTTLNPYIENKAVTFAWNAGITCAYDSKASSMVIDGAKTGNWTGLSNVAFGESGTTSVAFKVASTKAASVTIMLDAKTVAEGGTKVGTVQIATGDSSYRTIYSTLSQKVTGTHDIFFIYEGADLDVASWKFDEIQTEKPSENPTEEPTDDPSENPSTEVPDVTVSYRTHVQDDGWQNFVSNGAVAGTSGRSLRLEGIEIKVEGNPNLEIAYTTHVQDYGWMANSYDGAMSGTSGESKRLEAIMINLQGTDADKYDIYYRVHAQEFGWLGWAKNGAPAGTAGYGYRLEAIQIVIVKKGEATPTTVAGIASGRSEAYIAANSSETPSMKLYGDYSIAYTTHVQEIGWQDYVRNGAMAGTSGKSLRLEGIKIKFVNSNTDGAISYRTHVQDYGWMDYVSNDTMSGTSGESKRLEAIEIKLTGAIAEQYDVYYRVHAEDVGWMGWAKNGEQAGTSGFGRRLEGIQIILVKKGETPPSEVNGITSTVSAAFIQN